MASKKADANRINTKIKYGRNIIVSNVHHTQEFLLLSDIHFDNPKCKRDVLKKHLDIAKERNMKVAINGDFFCLMQGKYDPRRSKKDIMPIHNSHNYLDLVIEEAVDWWTPYAENLEFIGYGNHCASIIKNTETDPLRRFVDLLNYKCKTNVLLGGYGGWWKLRIHDNTFRCSYTIKYYHGSGGGGVITKGLIDQNRLQVRTEGADCMWQGHIHELLHVTSEVEYLSANGSNSGHTVKLKYIDHIRTSTYKEEYEDGFGGFHIERGASPKPIGGYIMSFNMHRTCTRVNGVREDTTNLTPSFVQLRDK